MVPKAPKVAMVLKVSPVQLDLMARRERLACLVFPDTKAHAASRAQLVQPVKMVQTDTKVNVVILVVKDPAVSVANVVAPVSAVPSVLKVSLARRATAARRALQVPPASAASTVHRASQDSRDRRDQQVYPVRTAFPDIQVPAVNPVSRVRPVPLDLLV